jgi:hypothetical protein
MLTYRCHLFVLLAIILIYYSITCVSKELHVYTEPSGYQCYWRGPAPFCFLRHGCPVGLTTMKIDKRGDGGYCWIGFKTYCCLVH